MCVRLFIKYPLDPVLDRIARACSHMRVKFSALDSPVQRVARAQSDCEITTAGARKKEREAGTETALPNIRDGVAFARIVINSDTRRN